MYQAYERPKTPQRFNATPKGRDVELSPFREGKPNDKYANPSMLSHDVFYNKHYENPNKQMTPVATPLGIPPNGYGKLTDYRDRYKEISGNPGDKSPAATKEQIRSQLRDNYSQKSGRATPGAVTPTRSAQGQPVDYRAQESRTPTRRNEVRRDELQAEAKTPSRRSAADEGAYRPSPIRGSQQAPAGQGRTHSQIDPTEARSVRSGVSSLAAAELICDNCVNRHMADDKRQRTQAEKAQDEKAQTALLNKEQIERRREAEEQEKRRERFKQEAIDHWEETKRLKALQKQEEKNNDVPMKGLFYDRELTDQQNKDLAERRRQQLRNDLKKQIRDKKHHEEQTQKELNEIPNTGLPIGNDMDNRYERFRDAHKAALKEQIEEKSRQKVQEKELDKRLQEQFQRETKEFQKTEQDRKQHAEQVRKDHFKKEMDRFNQERDAKRRREEDERLRDLELEQINKNKSKQEDDKKQDAMKRREEAHLAALKDQMDEAARKRVDKSKNRNKKKRSARSTRYRCSSRTRSASCTTARSATTSTRRPS